jgi:hypothetical protein
MARDGLGTYTRAGRATHPARTWPPYPISVARRPQRTAGMARGTASMDPAPSPPTTCCCLSSRVRMNPEPLVAWAGAGACGGYPFPSSPAAERAHVLPRGFTRRRRNTDRTGGGWRVYVVLGGFGVCRAGDLRVGGGGGGSPAGGAVAVADRVSRALTFRIKRAYVQCAVCRWHVARMMISTVARSGPAGGRDVRGLAVDRHLVSADRSLGSVGRVSGTCIGACGVLSGLS